MTITFSTAAQPMPPQSEPGAALPGPVTPGPVPGAAVLPLFAQFLGLAGLTGTQAEAAEAGSDPADTPDSADATQGAEAAGSQDDSVLPAMAMPLPNMAPVPMAPVAMNNTAWLSGAAGLERGVDEVAAVTGRVASAAVAPQSPADGAPGLDAGAARAQAVPKAGADSAPGLDAGAARAQAAPKTGADSAAFAARTLSLPVQALGGTRESAAATLPSASLPATALTVQSASGDSEPSAHPSAERGIAPPAAWGGEAAPAAASPAAGTIRLAGQAPQWQQALKEALGDRLSVQLERNMEHAVIRIDPPMLGRIEISVRHAAGALQVNLSASNGEVLQQLRSIGESMRNDLAQRQYTEVSVNITPTPRGSATPSFADGGDGARGRHPGRDEQEDGPGRALSEAGQAFSTFALSGQE